jgi:hypothetical protein
VKEDIGYTLRRNTAVESRIKMLITPKQLEY